MKGRPIAAVIVVMIVLSIIFFFPKSGISIPLPMEKIPDVQFDVTIFHDRYEPNIITVQQGSLVRINAVAAPGTSGYSQGITIDEYGVKASVSSETVPAQIDFVAENKGTVQAYCGSCLNGPFGADAPDKRLTIVVN